MGDIMRMRALISAGAACGVLLTSGTAQATDLWCTTKVAAIGAHNELWMQLDASNGSKWTQVCRLNGASSNNISAQGCQGMMAILLSAKGLGKSVTLHLFGPGSYASCSALPVEWDASINAVWVTMVD
jgi:hypothetical protein